MTAAVMFTLNLLGDEVQRLSTMREKCVYSLCKLEENDIFELGQFVAETTSVNLTKAIKRKPIDDSSKNIIQVSRIK